MFDKANKNYYYFCTGTTPLRETKYLSINIILNATRILLNVDFHNRSTRKDNKMLYNSFEKEQL